MQLYQKTIKIWLLVLILGVAASRSYAQEEAFTAENSGIETLEEPMEFGDGSKGGVGLRQVSLRRFCPSVGNQAGQPAAACLGWAFGYGCMSIANNKRANILGNQLAKEAFSAYFPFEMLQKEASSCQISEYIPKMRNILTQVGNVKANYDQKTISCKSQPNQNHVNQAAQYRVGALDYVFSKGGQRGNSFAQIEFKTKAALSKGSPVVVLLQIDDSFRQLKSAVWQPSNTGKTAYQPVVVIGFDDNRQMFEIFNSMGTAWGNQGFAYIGYNDFTQWAKNGTKISLIPKVPVRPRPSINPTPSPSPRPNPTPSPNPPAPLRPEVVLRGSADLRQVNLTGGSYSVLPIVVSRKGKFYETKKTFDIAERVQFVSNQLPQFGYVYVLSIDAAQRAKLHFPKQGESAYVADENSRLVFPRPLATYDENNRLVVTDKGFVKERNGADWLIVLYSKQKIASDQLQNWVDQLAVPTDRVVATLEKTLDSSLVPWQSVKFNAQTMQFSVQSNQGSVVPLIIKIKGY